MKKKKTTFNPHPGSALAYNSRQMTTEKQGSQQTEDSKGLQQCDRLFRKRAFVNCILFLLRNFILECLLDIEGKLVSQEY